MVVYTAPVNFRTSLRNASIALVSGNGLTQACYKGLGEKAIFTIEIPYYSAMRKYDGDLFLFNETHFWLFMHGTLVHSGIVSEIRSLEIVASDS